MRPCTLRIASAADGIEATSLDAALLGQNRPSRTPIHIKPLAVRNRIDSG